MAVSTVARPCSIAVSTVSRPRLMTSFTVPAIQRSLSRPTAMHGLDHNLHGIGFWMGGHFYSLNSVLNGKAMRDQLGEIESAAITLENEVRYFIQDFVRRRIRTEQRFLVDA